MPKERKPPSLRDKALAHLARREHSRAELARKLEQAGHAAEEIEALLDEFETRNWLSDRRFAESYVADHRVRYGEIKLAHELRQRGVDENIIQAVLEVDSADEPMRARHIWIKKYGELESGQQATPQQIRYMMGRGFSLQTVRWLFKNENP